MSCICSTSWMVLPLCSVCNAQSILVQNDLCRYILYMYVLQASWYISSNDRSFGCPIIFRDTIYNAIIFLVWIEEVNWIAEKLGSDVGSAK